MKNIPSGRLEFPDKNNNWFSLATLNDIEVDDDIYALLQALNDEVL